MHSGAPAAVDSNACPGQSASCKRPDILSGGGGGGGGISISRRSSTSTSTNKSSSSSISSSVLVRKSSSSSIIVVHDYGRRSSTMTTTTTTKRKGTGNSSFESQTNRTGPGPSAPASPSCATTTKTNGANSLAANSSHESANEVRQGQVFSWQANKQPIGEATVAELSSGSSRAITAFSTAGATNQRHNRHQSVKIDLTNSSGGVGERDGENAKFTLCSPTTSQHQQNQEEQQQRREDRRQQSSQQEQADMNRIVPLAARSPSKSAPANNNSSNNEMQYYHAKQVIVVDSSAEYDDDDDDDDGDDDEGHDYADAGGSGAGYDAGGPAMDYSRGLTSSKGAAPCCYSPSASITQTNRANFYNNLVQANNSGAQLKHNTSNGNYNNNHVDAENILLFATEHDAGRPTTSPTVPENNTNGANKRQQQQQWRGRPQKVGRGQQQLMTKSKSATLPNNNSDLDSASNYNDYEIRPTTRGTTNGQQRQEQQQQQRASRRQPTGTAIDHNGKESTTETAIRSSTVTTIKSPAKGSFKLAKTTSTTIAAGAEYNSHHGPFGGESQRASRLSLFAAAPTRMGKFVNYYPATRQPQNAGSPSHKRHTSPYAFHVPLYRQRNQHHNHCQRAKSPLSPHQSQHYHYGQHFSQPPVSYMYVNGAHDEQVMIGDERRAVAPAVKQACYGYVAPIDRLEADRQLVNSSDQLRQQQQQQPMPIGKFNKTLRSRTIAHIPGMVQVSVGDNCLPTQSPLKSQRQVGDLTGGQRVAPAPPRLPPLVVSSGVDDSASDYYYNATNLAGSSEGDLLKAHRIAWRHSNKFEFGYDNPFKPGTELSWEADLMVRLIKRGYPIDELPNLVQATKEVRSRQQHQCQYGQDERQARSKSCDKLATSNRQHGQREQSDELAANAWQQQQHQQHQKAGGYLESNIRQFNGRDNSIRYDTEDSSNKRPTAIPDDLEPCKRVWANSLSRAKSMPRFYSYSTTSDNGGPGSAAINKTSAAGDADSLDKLITSIEREIGDLLRDRSPGSPDSGIKATGSMSTSEPDDESSLVGPDDAAGERGSLVKVASRGKRRSPQAMSGSKSAQTLVAPALIATRKGKRNQKQDLTSSKSSSELLLVAGNKSDSNTGASKGQAVMERKKKSRCCMIQ